MWTSGACLVQTQANTHHCTIENWVCMSETLNSENCFEYLKAVIDPEIYQNIVDLGLVYGVDVRADEGGEPTIVDVTMTYTTPMCPLGPQIIADVEQVLHGQGRQPGQCQRCLRTDVDAGS